jgi:hypothetical protein
LLDSVRRALSTNVILSTARFVSWRGGLAVTAMLFMRSVRGFGIVVGLASWRFMPVVCESVGAIGTGFLRSVEVFRRRVGSGLVGVLVTGDCAEHIWRFRKAEPPDAVWWVASGSRNAGLVPV